MIIPRLTATILLLIATLLPVLSPVLRAQTVFLKNGKIHEGKIAQNTREYIFLRDKEGKSHKISKTSILRISYRDIYRGKFYVRLYDGTDFLAYMVDENTDSTVFRKKLTVNREFTLPAGSIQFTTRTNPTDLKGIPSRKHISLTWNPPFNPVKGYRIYVKIREDKKCIFVAFTKSTRYDLRHLQSRADTSIIVKAVDVTGDESLPSNTVTVTTGTLPPPPPKSPAIKKKPGGGLVSWKPDDPYGRVRAYRVYHIEGASRVKKGETSKTELLLTDIDFKTKQDFFIRSVDRHGEESADSPVVSNLRGLDVYLLGTFGLPDRNFSDLHTPGGGFTAGVSFINTGIYNLTMGVETSFLYLKGRKSDIDFTALVPLYYMLGYRITLGKIFFLEPFLSLGGSINIVSFGPGSARAGETSVEFEFMPRAGLACSFALNDFISLRVRGAYGGLIEREGFMDFITVDCGVSCRLYY